MVRIGLNLCSKFFPLNEQIVEKTQSKTKISIECFDVEMGEQQLHRKIYRILISYLFEFNVLGESMRQHHIFERINDIFWQNFTHDWQESDTIKTASDLHSLNIIKYIKFMEEESSYIKYWDLDSILLLGIQAKII